MEPIQPPNSLYIEGYTDRVSYLPGEEIAIQVSSALPKFEFEFLP